MTVKVETRATHSSCLVTIFSLQTINYVGKSVTAKSKANLKPELKMKVA